ncbi:MAG TPA: DUF4352 domain-containing protein [Thermoflexia bacterium]|nr:DUF4352 domain-containing protein [Thermoflexia bacterium]
MSAVEEKTNAGDSLAPSPRPEVGEAEKITTAEDSLAPSPRPEVGEAEKVTTAEDGLAPSPLPEISKEEAVKKARPFPPTWAFLVLLLGIIVVVAVGVGALRQLWISSSAESGAQETAVGKLATFDSPPDIPENAEILQENGAPVAVVSPHKLQLPGASYAIVATPLEGTRWPVPTAQQDVAVWVYGTVVNYVVGLPYITTTTSLLGGLASTDHITLTLSNGNELIFGSPQARRYPLEDTTPLSQRRPGLTLVVLGGEEADRLVVQARYLPEAATGGGKTQQLGELLVALLTAGMQSTTVNGQNFLVEYRLTNQGAEPLDTALFDLVLEDGQGQRYAVNSEVSYLGEGGPLPALISAGETVAVSAGYRAPKDLQPPLTWILRVDPTSEQAARFPLAYRAPLPGPPQPQVELLEVFADQGRDVIVINGVVRNSGESALAVTSDNVKLSSSGGEAELRAQTPPFPWQIPGGGKQSFELQFQRPAGVDSVLLDIWGFTFRIEGLP